MVVDPLEFLTEWLDPLLQPLATEQGIAREHEAAIIALTAELFDKLLARAIEGSPLLPLRSRFKMLLAGTPQTLENENAQQLNIDLRLPSLSVDCFQCLIRGMSASTLSRLVNSFILPKLQIYGNQSRLKKSTGTNIGSFVYQIFISLFETISSHSPEHLLVYLSLIDTVSSSHSLPPLRIAAIRLIERMIVHQMSIVFSDPSIPSHILSSIDKAVNMLIRSMEKDPSIDVRSETIQIEVTDHIYLSLPINRKAVILSASAMINTIREDIQRHALSVGFLYRSMQSINVYCETGS